MGPVRVITIEWLVALDRKTLDIHMFQRYVAIIGNLFRILLDPQCKGDFDFFQGFNFLACFDRLISLIFFYHIPTPPPPTSHDYVKISGTSSVHLWYVVFWQNTLHQVVEKYM